MDKKPICFIAMPTGRTEAAKKDLEGWYDQVYVPVVAAAGYEPFLSVRSSDPVHITDDIRRHLVDDAMGIFDLAGVTSTDRPNENVMYELGIRHAFQQPAVIYSWDASLLPFDTREQRTIVFPRDIGHMAIVKQQLHDAIAAANAGRFYNPMVAIQQAKLLESAAGTNEIVAAVRDGLESLKEEISLIPLMVVRETVERELFQIKQQHLLREEVIKLLEPRSVSVKTDAS